MYLRTKALEAEKSEGEVMAKGKGKSFFNGSGKLKLQREIEADRDTKSGNKGFLSELKRRDHRRAEYREGKELGQNDALFRGQAVAPSKEPEKQDSEWMKKSPEEAELEPKAEGVMPIIHNFNALRKGLK